MHCLACDKMMSDREANRKYQNHEHLKGEDKYVGLCDRCIEDTGINCEENPNDEGVEIENFED